MNNISIYDSNSTVLSVKTTDNAGVHTPHHIIDSMPAVTVDGNVGIVIPGQHIDSFSRIRTSAPAYRFDSQLTYQIDTDLWDVKTVSGSGSTSYDSTNRCATLSATHGSASHEVLQSHYHAAYTPGRSQLAIFTFSFGAALATAGEERGAGYYDGTNGIYLLQNSTGLHLGIGSSTSNGNEVIDQADWNVDSFDGNGPSGILLDVSKTQIMVISMQALYAGRVTVGFDVGGSIYVAHVFDHSNDSSYPYIAQASLPIRYWTKAAVASSAPVTMKAICSSVISEGGVPIQDMNGRPFVSTGELANSASGTILVIRCKAQLNSINQNALVVLTDVSASVADAGCWVELRRNATVTAGTFTDVNASSVVEESFAGNAGTDPVVTAGTGTLIDRFFLPASASVRTTGSSTALLGKVLLAYSHLLGAGDTISVLFNGGGATTDVQASLRWKEIR